MFMAPSDPIFRALLECRWRRVRSRIITEIEKENIEHFKELMKAFELHHLDDVKGNFGIGDGIYYRG
jgi:transcriptional regulator of NAD metabolism